MKNEIIKMNLNNANDAVKLLKECNYEEFEDLSDLKSFHNKLYQHIMLVKKSLETFYIEPSTDVSAEEFNDWFENDPFDTNLDF